MADEDGKIFVGALAGSTTAEGLEKYFSKFGKVIDSRIMKDKMTNLSRGFGFVTFENPDDIGKALESRPHFLDNKQIDPKPCTPRDIQNQKKEAERAHVRTHKIFVGGLTQNMVEDDLRQYFIKFGGIEEVVFAISKEDGKNRGFGFVTFEEANSVDETVKIHFHMVGGKRVEVKRATPLTKTKPPNHSNGAQMQGGFPPNSQGGNWSDMGWGYGGSGMYEGYGMGGNQMASQGSYSSNSGYGGYGGYGGYSSYGYGGYGEQAGSGYSQMGSYSQHTNAPYYSSSGNRNSAGDSKSYHPYKRR